MLTLESLPGQPIRLSPEFSFLRLLRILIILVGLLMPLFGFSQNVGINSTGAAPNPSAMLDIASTNSGLLIPRMSMAQRLAIASPATGLLVYDNNYNQFFFFDGFIWDRFLGTYSGWNIYGNISGGSAIIGTINNAPFPVYTNNMERMRVTEFGDVWVGGVTPIIPSRLYVTNTTDMAIYATTSAAPVASIYGQNTGNTMSVYGWTTNGTNFPGIFGRNGGTNAGIRGAGGNASWSVTPVLTGPGGEFFGAELGLFARCWTLTSTGAVISGNTSAPVVVAGGCGASISGTTLGTVSHANGTGLVGAGNSLGAVFMLGGSGGAFSGLTTGAYVVSSTGGGGEAIYSEQFGNVVRVNYWNGFTQFKIAGAGTMPVSCTIKDSSGTDRTMYCAESPDFHFTDYGSGQLQNGRTHIEIDPLLAGKILVDENHPLRVFIQLEGDTMCEGVVVANKNGTGFDVIELRNGHSNASFQWQIVCSVKDEMQENGRVNHLSNIRFQPMGEKRETKEAEIKRVEQQPENELPTDKPAKK